MSGVAVALDMPQIYKIESDQYLYDSGVVWTDNNWLYSQITFVESLDMQNKPVYEWNFIICEYDYYGDLYYLQPDDKWQILKQDKIADRDEQANTWCGNETPSYTIMSKYTKADLSNPKTVLVRTEHKPHYYELHFWVGENSSKYTVTNTGADDDDIVLYLDGDTDSITGSSISDYAGTNDSLTIIGSLHINTTVYKVGDGSFECGTSGADSARRGAQSWLTNNVTPANVYENYLFTGWFYTEAGLGGTPFSFNNKDTFTVSSALAGELNYKNNNGGYDDNNMWGENRAHSRGNWGFGAWYYNGTHQLAFNGSHWSGTSEDRVGFPEDLKSESSLCEKYFGSSHYEGKIDDLCLWDNIIANYTDPEVRALVNAIEGNASLGTPIGCYVTYDIFVNGEGEEPEPSNYCDTTTGADIYINFTQGCHYNSTVYNPGFDCLGYGTGTATINATWTCNNWLPTMTGGQHMKLGSNATINISG